MWMVLRGCTCCMVITASRQAREMSILPGWHARCVKVRSPARKASCTHQALERHYIAAQTGGGHWLQEDSQGSAGSAGSAGFPRACSHPTIPIGMRIDRCSRPGWGGGSVTVPLATGCARPCTAVRGRPGSAEQTAAADLPGTGKPPFAHAWGAAAAGQAAMANALPQAGAMLASANRSRLFAVHAGTALFSPRPWWGR